MASSRLNHVAEGEAISAREHNAMVDLLNQVAQLVLGATGSGGVQVTQSNAGLLIALMGLKDRVFPVKINAAPAPDVALLPSQCTYGYLGLDSGFTDTNVTPKYGRNIHGDECAVYPAKVGDLAFIFRNPQDDGTHVAELWILTECPARGPCQ